MQLDVALLTIGALMLVLGLLSGWIRASYLSEPLIALCLGVVLGPKVTALLDIERWGPRDEILLQATRVTLAISLMSVALRLPRGHVRRRLGTLLTLLGLVMPAMWLASSALFVVAGLSAPWAFLIGAAVTPTDPIVATSIVTGKVAETNLPSRIRDVLSSESGANDGLALPFVAAGLVWVTQGAHAAWGHWFLKSVVLEVQGAILFGWVVGFVAGRGRADALYVGWFGPIGVAALYYALYVRKHTGSDLPWAFVTLVVVASLAAHGLSATPLTRLYGKHGGRAEAAAEQQQEQSQ